MTKTLSGQKKLDIKTSNPMIMCLVVTLIAALGAFIALITKSPLLMFLFLLPTVIYEVIRTEPGASTKFSSILLLILILLEIVLIVFGINFDLGKLFGESEKVIAGYSVPLGDIKIFGPLLMTILSVILVFRTYGPYTKWLSIIIAGGSLVSIFLISPQFFQQAMRLIINSLFDRFNALI